MSYTRTVLVIAAWEFRRFFKWKEQLFGLVLGLVAGLVGFGGYKFVTTQASKPLSLIVVNEAEWPLEAFAKTRFDLTISAGMPGNVRASIRQESAQGLLHLVGDDPVLLIDHDPGWLAELQGVLGEIRRGVRIERSGIPAEQLALIAEPLRVDVERLDVAGRAKQAGASRAERLWAIVVAFLLLMSVFVGHAYLFMGITGEKQARMTEMIVSAVPPRAWIDGKIVGLSLLSLVTLLSSGLMVVGFLVVGSFIRDQPLISHRAVNPWLLLQTAIIALLTFYFWLAIFGAIAATIDNPYNSNRAAFLYLPILPMAVVFLALGSADAWWVQLLGVLPGTSSTMLPFRLVSGEAAFWEFPLALVLLLAVSWVAREVAGRIFRLGMLMYGKEPSVREMMRWVVRTGE